MTLLVHGIAGGWDELIIAAVALVVLWVAVKLAGRGRHDEEEPDETVEPDAPVEDGEIHMDPVQPPPPPAVKRGG
jgi:hypothetical protein